MPSPDLGARHLKTSEHRALRLDFFGLGVPGKSITWGYFVAIIGYFGAELRTLLGYFEVCLRYVILKL